MLRAIETTLALYNKFNKLCETNLVNKAVVYIIYYVVYFYFQHRKASKTRHTFHTVRIIIDDKSDDEWCFLEKIDG